MDLKIGIMISPNFLMIEWIHVCFIIASSSFQEKLCFSFRFSITCCQWHVLFICVTPFIVSRAVFTVGIQ